VYLKLTLDKCKCDCHFGEQGHIDGSLHCMYCHPETNQDKGVYVIDNCMPNKEAKIYCPHCYKIIELEMDKDKNLYVIEENEEDA